MKKTFAWALSALLAVTLSAQKTISIETDADEVVKLWDNQTAPHSSEETADEELNAKKHFSHTSETVREIRFPLDLQENQDSTVCPILIPFIVIHHCRMLPFLIETIHIQS